MLSSKDAAQFPFLEGSKSFVKGFDMNNLDLQLIDDYLFNFIYGKKTPDYFEPLDTPEAIQRFVGCCIVLNQVGRSRAITKFASYEAAKYIMRLKYILNKKGVDEFHVYASIIFKTIYKQENFISTLKTGGYTCRIMQYLDLIEDVIGLNQKYLHLQMTNQAVTKGYVLFQREILLDIFEQRIKYFIMERINAMFDQVPTDRDVKKRRKKKGSFHGTIPLTNELNLLIDKYEYIDTYTQVYRYEGAPKKEVYDITELADQVLKLKQGKTPPCITTIIEAFGNRNVSHFERFLLASFLISKQVDFEEIIEIFSRDIKFNREITEEQLKQLSSRDYKPPSCSKIDTNKCCYRNEVCGFIQNPIQLISD